MFESLKRKTDLKDVPIPRELPNISGWKEVPIIEKQEPLVAMGPFSDFNRIYTDSIYFGERENSPYSDDRPEGSLITMFVRKSVAEDLLKAQKLLPANHHLIIFDSYRTLKVQGSLYTKYYQELKAKYPDWSEEQLSTETQKYVSVPSTDPSKPSP